jgi:hypothetical protein
MGVPMRVTPLGGKRSERKRLKRCAHGETVPEFRQDSTGVTLRCVRCGAVGMVDAFLFERAMTYDAGTRREAFARRLPNRIARKAADA